MPTQSEISGLNTICKDIEKRPKLSLELEPKSEIAIDDESSIKPTQVKIQTCNTATRLTPGKVFESKNASSQPIISKTEFYYFENIAKDTEVTVEYVSDSNLKSTFSNSVCGATTEEIKQVPKRIIVKKGDTKASKNQAPIPKIITLQHFCKDCDQGFKTEGQLKRHARVHLVYNCEQCVKSRVYLSKASLDVCLKIIL